jgi:hypothetical protein
MTTPTEIERDFHGTPSRRRRMDEIEDEAHEENARRIET